MGYYSEGCLGCQNVNRQLELNNNIIDFSFCTDGVQIFRSSKVTMWRAILNLPPSKRFKSQNILLNCLWVGPSKPPMNHLLEPLTQRISQLSSAGITIQVGSGYAIVKATLSLAVFDLPAKAAVLNCKQFNGHYGCSVCLNRGVQQGRC